MPYTDHIPAYCHHKASGQAVVTLNGDEHYLGTHGTAASRAAYDRIIGQWMAGGRQPIKRAVALTIGEMMLAYDAHIRSYYKKPDGTLTTEVTSIKYALRTLRKTYGVTPAGEFGPLKLMALQTALIAEGGSRNGINQKIGRIRAMFKWAVSREMIPPEVYQALATVRGLAYGRSAAKENEPVRPAPQAHIDAALLKMPTVIAAMVKLQLATGARPGEIAAMKMADFDLSGPVWKYRPQQHKTAYRGHARVILLGPKAQAIIKPYLRTDTTSYLFSPADSMTEQAVGLGLAFCWAGRPGKPARFSTQPEPVLEPISEDAKSLSLSLSLNSPHTPQYGGNAYWGGVWSGGDGDENQG